MHIKLPELSLVVLIGASGSGKSSFAKKHFLPGEILSSDFFRGLVSNDETSLDATKDAFDALHHLLKIRLKRGLLTVIDATNVQREARQPLLDIAKEFHVFPVAIVFKMPDELCLERNKLRPDRQFGSHVVRNHNRDLRRSLKFLDKDFRYVHVLDSLEEVEAVTIERQKLWNNRKEEHGPFDIIGDVHGCADELEELLEKLGYTFTEKAEGRYRRIYSHPEGRKAFFVGDLVDRGPRVLDSYELVKNMMDAGTAMCVPGNHDAKLLRKLNGKDVKVTHGLGNTLAELEALPSEIRSSYEKDMAAFIDDLVSHYVLDDGKLVVAHAGMKESLQGRTSGTVRAFAMFGETTGETDEFGLPVRYNWALDYRGKAMVVYGHTPVPEASFLNNTINIDTGCVYGGALTALRYPERELVSVPAKQMYAEPSRPFLQTADALSVQQEQDDVLDIDDVLGKKIISTRLMNNVTTREENAKAALEVMSRFVIDPKWLIYLPPTMSPVTTANDGDLLEHPDAAFAYYREQGVERVVCEEKHMGSRTIVIIAKDADAIRKRFGIIAKNTVGERIGMCYTRTGRPFFSDVAMESALLGQLCDALTETNFWDDLKTDWVCFDAELMPWSSKAQALLEHQYAAVGTSAKHSLSETLSVLQQTKARGLDVASLLTNIQQRSQSVHNYIEAYRRYCWDVKSVADLKLAPFHIMATEGAVHVDKMHVWHMESIAKYAVTVSAVSMQATNFKEVELQSDVSVAEATQWWEDMTGKGGEGMVVKPLDFIVRGKKGYVQPALKVRGKEYLRIIYGPEYTLPQNLERLRARNVSAKRMLALREFALGVEALERFVKHEPLRRVHECVFAVLALETEPLDPRL
ncbi:MAG: polynucleotide kinase-phosphatase [Trueperaceae bacterium]